MMDETGTAGRFKQFALELYGSEGVAAACLHLQNRHVLDVNLVLFAAFIGARRRQTLTTSGWCGPIPGRRVASRGCAAAACRAATAQDGSAPAPNELTTRLRGSSSKSRLTPS